MAADAVIFDCDGVLVDSEALGLEASARYLRGHGLPWSEADLVQLFTGLRDDVFAHKLTDAYVAANGKAPSTDFFQGLIDERRKRKDELQAVDGAREALAAIEIKAVASSSRGIYLRSKLERTGLLGLADPHVYSAELVAHGKPAPDIFLYAAERIETPPDRCIVLEDSVNGVKAGRCCGHARLGICRRRALLRWA